MYDIWMHDISIHVYIIQCLNQVPHNSFFKFIIYNGGKSQNTFSKLYETYNISLLMLITLLPNTSPGCLIPACNLAFTGQSSHALHFLLYLWP